MIIDECNRVIEECNKNDDLLRAYLHTSSGNEGHNLTYRVVYASVPSCMTAWQHASSVQLLLVLLILVGTVGCRIIGDLPSPDQPSPAQPNPAQKWSNIPPAWFVQYRIS